MESAAAIIVNYNQSADVEKCVSLLKKQTCPAFTKIIVDNHSPSAGEREAIRRIAEKSGCVFIQNDRNAGYSAGNNLGIRYAEEKKIDWCMIINPDVEIRDPGYVEKVLGTISGYPETVAAGTNILLPDGKRQNPMRELSFHEEFFWPAEALKQKRSSWEGYLGENRTGYCEKLIGCCLFVKTDFMARTGYLDENVFLYSEEPILAKKVKRNNRKMLYIRELTAYHQHADAETGSARERMEIFAKSRRYYLTNYSGYGKIRIALLDLSRNSQRLIRKLTGK